MHQHTAIGVTTHTGLGVETEVIGVEQGVAIDHLDNGGVNLSVSPLAIVDSAVAIDEDGVLIDYHA